METQGFQNAKIILEKNKSRRLILPDFKIYKAIIVTEKDRQRSLEQTNGIETNRIFTKSFKRQVCSPSDAETTKYPYIENKEINFELYLIPYQKLIYFINLNIGTKINIENTG